MALTPRFGFTHFDAATSGSLFGDGGKFTGRDRRVIDRILAAIEVHNHDGGDRLGDPEFEPTLTLFSTGGTLPAGRTFYYRVSWLDEFALETAAGPEVSVSTPGSIQSPSAPRAEAQSGGSLDEGLYWYGLTGFDAQDNETPISAPQVINITDWKQVEISAPNGFPTGTTKVSAWRQGPFDSGFTRLGTFTVVDPGVAMIPIMIDDGSIASNPTLTPNQNLTGGSNSIEVTIPPLPVGAKRWRLYRSEASGAYPDFSLVTEVHETVTEGGTEVVTTFLDTGSEPGVGKPIETSQTLSSSRLLFVSEDGGIILGNEAQVSSFGALVLGHYAQALGGDAIAIGHLAEAPGDESIAIGHLTAALGTQGIAIGSGISNPNGYSVDLGDARHVVRVGGLAPRVIEATADVAPWYVPVTPGPLDEPERASVVLVDATAGAVVVDVQALATQSGAMVTVKKIDGSANTVTLDPKEGRSIDGASVAVLSTQYEVMTVVYSSTSDNFFEV